MEIEPLYSITIILNILLTCSMAKRTKLVFLAKPFWLLYMDNPVSMTFNNQ